MMIPTTNWRLGAALVAALAFVGLGAYVGWRLRPPEIREVIRRELVPGPKETIIREVVVPRTVEKRVPVVVERPGKEAVRTVTQPVTVTVTREKLIEVYPQTLTLEFEPQVRVHFGEQVAQAELVGDRRVTVVRISKPGEPPAYAAVRLPDVDAALAVRSVVTDTRIVVRERRPISFSVYLGGTARIRPGYAFHGAYVGAEVERRFGNLGPFEKFCRARGDYYLTGEGIEARGECGVRW